MKFGCSKIKRFIISFHWIFMFQNVDVPKCSLNFRFAKMWIFPVTHGSFGDSSRDFWTLEALLQRLLRYIFRRAGGGRKELYIFQLLQISQICENTYLHIHIQITLYLIYNLYCVYTCIYIYTVCIHEYDFAQKYIEIQHTKWSILGLSFKPWVQPVSQSQLGLPPSKRGIHPVIWWTYWEN